MGNKALLNRIIKIKDIDRQIAELKKVQDGIKDEIKSEMTSAEVDELTVGDYIVRYKSVSSNKFDSAAFKKAHSKMYLAFCNPSTSMRFTIN